MSGVGLLVAGCCCGSPVCPEDCSECPDRTVTLSGFDANTCVFTLGLDGTHALTQTGTGGCTWINTNINGGIYGVVFDCVDGVWTCRVDDFVNGWFWLFTASAAGGCLPTGGGWTETATPILFGVPCPMPDGAAVSVA